MLQNRGIALIVLGIAGIGLLAAADSPPAPPAAKPSTQPRLLPNGSIAAVISKETTRFTGPLNADGTVNFVAALDEVARQGVTKENNFAVVVLEVYGPADLAAQFHDEILKRLELTLPDKGDYFTGSILAGVTGTQFDAATSQPWRAEENPKMAKWLGDNQKRLDRLAEAAKRCTHYYCPLLSPDDPPEFITFIVPSLGQLKRTANTLKARAFLRFASGDFAGARADVDAIGRLGRLVERQPTLISWLVGIACEGVAFDACQKMAATGRLTAAQAQALRADAEKWPARVPAMQALESERLTGPDVIMMLERGQPIQKIINLVNLVSTVTSGTEAAPVPDGPPVIADFNPALAQFQEYFGRMAAAGALKTFAERRKAFDLWDQSLADLRSSPERAALDSDEFWSNYKKADVEGKRALMTPVLAKALPGLLIPSLSGVVRVEGKVNMHFDLTGLALALAAYHADKGAYPDTLEVLAPAYIKAIPQDLFIEKPLHYQREGKGYLLYSVGVDMKDDGGDEKNDMVVRAR